ncbi:MAG: 4-hydroxy-3-methylbut-2-enyl diphosphate reductase [Elusimicrobia bacterium]|nr:4-hydroxy-3-methylbut-2-enyl diphosphate reductase [Elusimicrobiota bacterium]MBP9698742.1 4-hydroxy-3-methylbut-2-enyl diphosphate reductase [Elusimicrobiota bacterium]
MLLARPRGFCAGVVRAVDIVDIALKRFSPPVYVRKEIVHNRAVVDDFKGRGVIFIDDLDEAPEGAVVVYSAHGVSPAVRARAAARRLRAIDATCPLVTKVHLEVHRFLREGYGLVLIGHRAHDEVEGTLGEAPRQIQLVETVDDVALLSYPAQAKVMILTQTTLSLDETRGVIAAIKARYPNAATPPKDDICYATQNRQDAVKELVTRGIDLLLVVGSKNSSNSQRLVDVARQSGCRAQLIDRAQEIDPLWLEGVKSMGVTAGASAPEHLVQGVLEFLAGRGGQVEEVAVREEDTHFSLPKELTEPSPVR